PWGKLVATSFVGAIRGLKGLFPLRLSAEPRSKLQRLWPQGKRLDSPPAKIIGGYRNDPLQAFACLRLNEREGVWTQTAIRNQAFPASSFALVQELIVFQLLDKVQDVLGGIDVPVSIAEVRRAAKGFTARVKHPTHLAFEWL